MTTTDAPDLATLFSPEHRADPYPAYRRWRENTPIAELAPGFLVLSSHEACSEVLRNPAFGHAEPGDDVPGPLGGGRPRGGDTSLLDDQGRPVISFLGLNPPDHTRLRRLVSKAFTARTVAGLVPRVEEITAELLDAALDAGEVDLLGALAEPLPVRVISEMLGVPASDHARFAAWSHAMARGTDPAFLLSDETLAAVSTAREEYSEYFRDLAARRRADPGDDLLSALVGVSDAGDTLTENELLVTCILLLTAGHETTVNLIGNGTLALLRNPEQLAALRDDADVAEPAVEELLRYDSPVQLTVRQALEDTTIGDVPAARGTVALLLVGAANRDPSAHEDPDRLDVTRPPSRHLAFGQGIHFCLGAAGPGRGPHRPARAGPPGTRPARRR
ncbi:cytochrome P450 [Pseudonocardia sediminis]|uniref:Cytochrome P450 n=1 Tax=Pseudonocardia sediminis TaxID=1397368 RepID=A0A4Q7UXR9_PSEST|nr:cytochrome P450 [Pseudonocardia sediminis]RZT86706.1 cytochrome P450 [Pseudonocardia sediminis]